MEKARHILELVWHYVLLTKATAIQYARHLKPLDNLSDNVLSWIFICVIFFITVSIVMPIIKRSLRISIIAAAIAWGAAFLTTASFWSILPFSGLSVLLFSVANRSGKELT